MNTKNYIIAGIVAGAVLLGASSFVFAELIVKAVDPTTMMPIENVQKMVLQIGPNGNVLLRGTVSAVGTNSLTVKSWGGDWVVNVASSTQLMPNTGMTQFKVGEFVGVEGSVNTGSAWTINAKLVRNWTAKKVEHEDNVKARQERHNNEQEVKNVIKNESPKNWQGTASNINVDAKTFTLTVDGSAYTVQLVSDATTVNQGFLSVGFANVKAGDTVRVWGPISGTTISAYVLRDISITEKDLKDGHK